MIPMSCPNCGRQGEVPLDRLNCRLKCKKCGTMFYMDETGSIVLGDPNDPKGRRAKKADAGPAVDLDFAQMIRDIPKPVRIGALALAIVATLGYGVTTLVGSIGAPDDVQGRSAYAAELFVDNKIDQLRKLAKEGTDDDLVKWHELMRPKLNYNGPRKSRRDVLTGGEVMNQSGGSAWSYATLAVVNPQPPAAPSATGSQADAPQNSLSMSLYWTRQNGQWVIDGTRTFNEASRPLPAGRRGGTAPPPTGRGRR